MSPRDARGAEQQRKDQEEVRESGKIAKCSLLSVQSAAKIQQYRSSPILTNLSIAKTATNFTTIDNLSDITTM